MNEESAQVESHPAVRVTLGPGFSLIAHVEGRQISIPLSTDGLMVLQRLLVELERREAQPKPSLGPTQALVDQWLREHKPQRVAPALDLDLDCLKELGL